MFLDCIHRLIIHCYKPKPILGMIRSQVSNRDRRIKQTPSFAQTQEGNLISCSTDFLPTNEMSVDPCHYLPINQIWNVAMCLWCTDGGFKQDLIKLYVFHLRFLQSVHVYFFACFSSMCSLSCIRFLDKAIFPINWAVNKTDQFLLLSSPYYSKASSVLMYCKSLEEQYHTSCFCWTKQIQ